MNTRETFWERVHEALDARRDPLDDERVQTELESAPELLDELATLQRSFDGLRVKAPGIALRRAAAGKRVAAAALVLVMGALLLRFAVDATRPDVDTSTATPAIVEGPSASVLSFQVTLIDESPTERVVTEFDGRTTTVTREYFGAPRTNDSSPSFFASLTTHVPSR